MKTWFRHDDSGFTLVELLVTITILAVLAAVVVFAVRGVTDKGKSSTCKTDRQSVEVAEEAFFARHGSYGDLPTLVTENLLREVPASSAYAVSVDVGTGDVSTLPDCSAL